MCRDFKSILSAENLRFKARLIVVASDTNAILDICPKSGHVLHSARVQNRPLRRNEKLNRFWPTGVALSPDDGDYYVCQYKVSLDAKPATG